MQSYREISVFVAHDFTSSNGYYDVEIFRRSVSQLFDKITVSLSSEYPQLAIRIIIEMNELIERLPAQVERQLSLCHFAIVDISTNNPNVLYELGHLTAKRTPLVIVKSKESGKKHSIPIDISDQLVFFYGQASELVQLLMSGVRKELHRILNSQTLPSGFLSRVWFPEDTRYIHVVSSSESQKSEYADLASSNYMYLDNLGDKDALLETMILLSRLYSTAKTFRYAADDFPARYIEDNLVVIGGPGEIDGDGNHICRQITHKIKSRVSYTADCEIMLCDGIHYEAELDSNGYMTKDYGYFARVPNPFDNTSTVILIHGIHTYGVLGAARAFSDHPAAQLNIKRVLEVAGSSDLSNIAFECFFQVSIISGEVMCPIVEEDKIFQL